MSCEPLYNKYLANSLCNAWTLRRVEKVSPGIQGQGRETVNFSRSEQSRGYKFDCLTSKIHNSSPHRCVIDQLQIQFGGLNVVEEAEKIAHTKASQFRLKNSE